MKSEALRVGVIGRTGKGDYGHGLDTVWADVPRCQVVAIADEHEAGRLNAQKRTKAANAYASYTEMLDKEKLDLVAVAPRWIDQHFEMALAAAERGLHIFMEKPFVPTLSQADDLIRACEMRHVKLAIAHQGHYTPTIPVIQKLIAEGQIGEVLELRGRGKEDDKRGGSEDLWILGSHVLDLMRLFAGNPSSCFATVTTQGRAITAADIAAGRKVQCPLLALWGKPGVIEKQFHALDDWRKVASDVRGSSIDCGHYIPEEAPDALYDELIAFLPT